MTGPPITVQITFPDQAAANGWLSDQVATGAHPATAGLATHTDAPGFKVVSTDDTDQYAYGGPHNPVQVRAPRHELVVDRDPDGPTLLTLFRDGEPINVDTGLVTYEVDPGGGADQAWVERIGTLAAGATDACADVLLDLAAHYHLQEHGDGPPEGHVVRPEHHRPSTPFERGLATWIADATSEPPDDDTTSDDVCICEAIAAHRADPFDAPPPPDTDCAIHVPCDERCGALRSPGGAQDELILALDHWESHEVAAGCSHGR